jgi:YHS domain-containing protein
MSEIGGLRKQLAALVEDAAARNAEEHSTRAREMREFDSRRGRFEQVAGAWASGLVMPRVQALAEALPPSGASEPITGGFGARATLDWSEEFPVSASLTVSILPDGSCARACVRVEPRLIPMLMGHPAVACMEFELEAADTQSLAQFLDRELLGFADYYLRVRETGSLYQRHTLVRDFVCDMTIRPSDAAETHTHNGVRYYFCSSACAARFHEDPEGYLRMSRAAQGGVA